MSIEDVDILIDSFSSSSIASLPASRLKQLRDAVITQLPTQSSIFLPTNRISLRDQAQGLLRVRDIYLNGLDALYRPHLRALKECYEGHDRCFVIGNGPSLNRTDLSVLKDEVTFAVNGFFLKSSSLDWTPTFYVVEDHLVAEDRREQINAFKGPIKLFPAYLGYCFEEGPDTIFYNHRPRKSWPDGFDFSTDAAEITYTGCTVTFSCLQLAYYLGFRTIYLIGVDSDYAIPADAEQKKDYGTGVLDMKSDDPNHFHPDYFGKGYRWHDPQVDKMLEAYAEARRVADLNGRRIVNATVGGRLEVFEREAFSTIFPKARGSEAMEAINARELAAREQAPEIPDARPQEPVTELPRLLVFDLTKRGNGTATGELKSTLFSGWPQDRYLQFYSGGIHQVAMDPDEPSEGSKVIAHDQAQVLLRARRFAPQVILYRPVPNNPALHEAAMHVIRSLDVPLVVWIMDDWPSRLAAEDPKTHAALDADLRELLDRAVLRLSICDAMSDAFEARYGVPFKAFANGIDPADWPAATGDRPEGPFLIRYAGSLAQDMTVDSVERVARVVERMGEEGIDVRLEIRTQATWHTRESHRFKGLKRTGLTSESLDREAYRAWLSEADALLMAYNFDEASKRYIRYSLANKLPECLVSGAAVLAHGPGEVATMAYLQAQDCACIVDEPDPGALARAIAGLVHDGEYRRRLSERARACAVARHNVHDIRRILQHEISLVAGRDFVASPLDQLSFERHMHVSLDEREVMAKIIEGNALSRTDCLKIGVDDQSLSVLKDILQDDAAPLAVSCISDDSGTATQGHAWRDLAEYLLDRGYTVYLSEWHPAIRHGASGDWRRMKRYPCELPEEHSRRNLLAFRNDPGQEALARTVRSCLISGMSRADMFAILSNASPHALSLYSRLLYKSNRIRIRIYMGAARLVRATGSPSLFRLAKRVQLFLDSRK